MTTNTLVERNTIPTAGMSQVIFVAKTEQVRCVVGSCIALTLYHWRKGIGALGHIVLPKSDNRSGAPGKFADTAIPHMVDTLAKEGANTAGMVAKICGGASMFGPGGPIQIGERNIEAVTKILKELRIPIVGEHIAGDKGRLVTFDCDTGQVTIAIARQEVEIL